MPEFAASLSVNREHLLQALKQIKRLPGIGEQAAVLTYANGELEIDLGGCLFCADAQGDWRGQVTVPFSSIRILATVPPDGEGPILFALDRERLKIGTLVTKCKWDGLTYPRIGLPVGATLLDKLLLRLTHSADDIERSDLTKTVEAAESERDKLIEKAVKVLVEVNRIVETATNVLQPLGISESKIRGLFHGGQPIAASPAVSAMRQSDVRRFLEDCLRARLSGAAASFRKSDAE
jgi:hypothetical protein